MSPNSSSGPAVHSPATSRCTTPRTRSASRLDRPAPRVRRHQHRGEPGQRRGDRDRVGSGYARRQRWRALRPSRASGGWEKDGNAVHGRPSRSRVLGRGRAVAWLPRRPICQRALCQDRPQDQTCLLRPGRLGRRRHLHPAEGRHRDRHLALPETHGHPARQQGRHTLPPARHGMHAHQNRCLDRGAAQAG